MIETIFLAWTSVLDPSVILIPLALTTADAIFFTLLDNFL